MSAKAIARELLPPVLLRALRAARPAPAMQPSLARTYASWDEAARVATGYDAALILERVEAATQRVLAGAAAFERDGVAFERLVLPFPLLAALLRAAVECNSELSVLDFGGSLGTTYRQCRTFLSVARELHWSIVEQPHFVRAGQARYTNEELRFYGTIAQAATARAPTVALCASSLQYTRDPHAALRELAATGCRSIVIDRTPLSDGAGDRIVVQHVPPSIYPASYPCWVLGKGAIAATLGREWELVADWVAADPALRTDQGDVLWCGLLFRRLA